MDAVDRLREWMSASGTHQTARAVRLGLNQSSVSSWLRRVSRPEAHHRAALQLLTGIEESAWLTDEERELIERARPIATAPTEPPADTERPTGTGG